MIKFKHFLLLEGGNLKLDTGEEATRIDLTRKDRQKIINDLIKMFKQMNKLFYKQHKKYIWCDEKLIDNLTIFSGSTKHFLNQKIPDEEFKKIKPTVGDIDVQFPVYLKNEILEFLKPNLKIGKFKYLGRNQVSLQVSTLWEYEGENLLIQIDFEFVDADELGCPFEFEQFAHSSDWNDLKQGIKGVFHKYLVGSLDFKNKRKIWLKKRNKIEKVEIHNFAFSVAKGLRTKYDYAKDKEGNIIYKDGEPVYRQLQTKESKYIKDLSAIFEILFGYKPTKQDLQMFYSFTGIISLMKQKFTKKQIEDVFKEFIQRIWGKKAQPLYRGNPQEDFKVKNIAYQYFLKEFPFLRKYEKEIKQMIEEYYKGYK